MFAVHPANNKFIENVIFSLFNYGANDRDNYLLLKLFKTALEEEIRYIVETPICEILIRNLSDSIAQCHTHGNS